MNLQSAAAAAEGVSPWYWLLVAAVVVAALVLLNWKKIQAAYAAAKPEAPVFVPVTADASLDQIGNLKNGFALLLEIDRYSPKSQSPAERDALILEGVARLLKARSEAAQ